MRVHIGIAARARVRRFGESIPSTPRKDASGHIRCHTTWIHAPHTRSFRSLLGLKRFGPIIP